MSVEAAGRPDRLRSLNRPRPVRVETDESNYPLAVHLSGRRCAVESVLEIWRIDDEWWRVHPVSRLYRRVALDDGRVVNVYQDLVNGRWFRQSY